MHKQAQVQIKREGDGVSISMPEWKKGTLKRGLGKAKAEWDALSSEQKLLVGGVGGAAVAGKPLAAIIKALVRGRPKMAEDKTKAKASKAGAKIRETLTEAQMPGHNVDVTGQSGDTVSMALDDPRYGAGYGRMDKQAGMSNFLAGFADELVKVGGRDVAGENLRHRRREVKEDAAEDAYDKRRVSSNARGAMREERKARKAEKASDAAWETAGRVSKVRRRAASMTPDIPRTLLFNKARQGVEQRSRDRNLRAAERSWRRRSHQQGDVAKKAKHWAKEYHRDARDRARSRRQGAEWRHKVRTRPDDDFN